MKDSLNKLTSYLDRLTQKKARNKLTSTLDDLTQQNARMESPQAVDYVLKITITGTGVGTVSYSPDTNSFINGQVVSLTAKAQAGSKFIRWTGDITGSHSVCNIRMDSTKLVVAEFMSADFRAEQKIGSTFAAASHSGMLQIETRPPAQVAINPIQSNSLNGASILEKKDIQRKYIGLDNRFIDHEDGTVTDTHTELMWMRCALGQTWNGATCLGSAKYHNLTLESELYPSFAGHKDWRLPELDELQSLITQSNQARPIIDMEVADNAIKSTFWTSSKDPIDSRLVCQVDFSDGKVYSNRPDLLAHIRLVRSSHNVTTSGVDSGTVKRTADFLSSTSLALTAQADDGSKRKEVPVKYIGHNNKFIDHGDGTVSDIRTGLMWVRGAVGQEWNGITCVGEAIPITCESAWNIHSNFAGHDGWRLPTIEELVEVALDNQGSRLDNLVFPNQPGRRFWSSSQMTKDHSSRYHLSPFHIGYELVFSFDSGVIGFAYPDSKGEYVRLVRDGIYFPIKIKTEGNGYGTVIRNPESENYHFGSKVTLTAHPVTGSKFKCWHGDATGHSATCMVTLDAAKNVSAEFLEIETFVLNAISTGTGTGTITRSLDAERYIGGTPVTLTACASTGSKFKCWHGAVDQLNAICTLQMNSEKNLSAEFILLEYFKLEINSIGTGKGVITQSPKASKYVEGSTVTLTAYANKGSEFKRWHGAATGSSISCTVTLDTEKTVSAEFIQLESFTLDIAVSGTGSGHIVRSVNADTYFSGSLFTLTAQADNGSIFNGWYGDASGLDEVCNVTMSSALSVGAEFERLTISDTFITIEMEKVDSRRLKDQWVKIFYITIRNKGQEQVRVKIPLTSFVSQAGQASEQNGWFSELVNGSKGVTLTAGAFCRMGLVYFHSDLKRGDSLHINVVPSKPFSSMSFVFKCIDAGKTFILVNASSEDKNQSADATPTLPAMTKLLKRIESLENSLSEVLRRLDGIQSNIPWTVKNLAFDQASPSLTLSELLKWLALQDRISVVELRARLLPLDLLPGAVINEINERALDLIGEFALEEVGNEIVVAKEILDEVLADWE